MFIYALSLIFSLITLWYGLRILHAAYGWFDRGIALFILAVGLVLTFVNVNSIVHLTAQ